MTDRRLDQIIGNVLRTGVGLSAMVVLAGGAWYLASGGGGTPDYRQFRATATGLHAIDSMPRPLAVIQIGLLILIATPVARVIFSLVAFALERDHLYTAITLAVLVVLLFSIGAARL